ncbi:MAG: ABC transporter substrate-binding protein [Alteromonadaceae bacterium]|uniref:TRAP transporter small permease protein n=2 Tax=Hydrocarboniclastica marina TaxID=2259620 RepID=A0A4P7XMI9_9ALTE|nr:ABC transporter substrate-binding protein [Alteromonadaceae bacterium]QCF27904.1 ABC transporter substrate-binding protein [Hydrocarboniclastica marina]
MRPIHAFMNGVSRLNDFIGRWVAILVFAMFVLLLLEVFMRYVMASPTAWTNELTQLLFGVYAVMAGGYVMVHRGHVNVDLLYSHLSRRAQAGVDIFTSIIFFIFMGAVLYFGTDMALESIRGLETSYSAWNPPIWPAKTAIPVAALLLLLQGVVKLLEDIMIALNLEPPVRHTDVKSHDNNPEAL